MTYQQLYNSTRGWIASHVAADEMAMFGRNEVVSEYSIAKVRAAEARDNNPKPVDNA